MRAIRNGDPPGRFLRKDEKTGFWVDIGDKKATEKTSQALREKTNEEKEKHKLSNLVNSPIFLDPREYYRQRDAAAAATMEAAGVAAATVDAAGVPQANLGVPGVTTPAVNQLSTAPDLATPASICAEQKNEDNGNVPGATLAEIVEKPVNEEVGTAEAKSEIPVATLPYNEDAPADPLKSETEDGDELLNLDEV